MHAFVYTFEANTRNVCVEKTFQLSWLILILFSLSHRWFSLRFLDQYSARQIQPLILNNNIDLNFEILTEIPFWLFELKITLVHSTSTSLCLLTQWIVVLRSTEWKHWRKIRCTILKIHELQLIAPIYHRRQRWTLFIYMTLEAVWTVFPLETIS